jgi:hypothetical protein
MLKLPVCAGLPRTLLGAAAALALPEPLPESAKGDPVEDDNGAGAAPVLNAPGAAEAGDSEVGITPKGDCAAEGMTPKGDSTAEKIAPKGAPAAEAAPRAELPSGGVGLPEEGTGAALAPPDSA